MLFSCRWVGTVVLNSDCGLRHSFKTALWWLHIECLGRAKHCWVLQPVAAEQGQTHHTAPMQEKPQAWLEEVRPRAPAGVGQAPELQTLPSSPLQVQSADRFLSCELKEGKQPPCHQLLQESCIEAQFTHLEKTKIRWFQRNKEQPLGKKSMRPIQVKSKRQEWQPFIQVICKLNVHMSLVILYSDAFQFRVSLKHF